MRLGEVKGVFRQKRFYAALAALIILFIMPLVTSRPFIMDIFIMTFLWAFLAGAWNVLGGYVGQFSLGPSAFFGIGAYTSSLLFIWLGVPPLIGMVVGAILSSGVALVIGYPSFRLRGHYFVLITLAFAEVLRIAFLNWRLVGGAYGVWMPVIHPDSLYNFQFHTTKAPYYYIVLISLLLELILVYKIEKSKIGYYFKAIREDEDAAEALGISAAKYKLVAAVISSALFAIGGTFFAQYVLIIRAPDIMTLDRTLSIVFPAIIGGMGTTMGPILGSFILTPIDYIIRASLGGLYRGVHMILEGVFLMVIVIIMPSGIMGLLKRKTYAGKAAKTSRISLEKGGAE